MMSCASIPLPSTQPHSYGAHLLAAPCAVAATPSSAELTKASSSGPSASTSTTYEDELSDMVWLAELGKPESKRLYDLEGSTVDVFNDRGSIGCLLKWDCSEREIFLYDSPFAHYSEPLGSCLILGGEAELPQIHAMESAGRRPPRPFGILPGSKLRQLMENDIALGC